MIPIKQKYRHDPGNGIWGDCHRACIASILHLDIDDVPNFGAGGPNGEEFHKRINEFLKCIGLVEISIPFQSNNGIKAVLELVAGINPNLYYLLGGKSRTGVNHTVVCLNSEIVHDPSLNDSGIIGPCIDGYYWISFLGSLLAVKLD